MCVKVKGRVKEITDFISGITFKIQLIIFVQANF